MAVEATTLVGSAKGTSVTAAIRRASEVTGARFGYLLATAKVESNLNPNAAAKTSSAGGLFQFIDRTWLGTLKEAGAQLGYSRYADAITRTNDGRYIVNDPAMRREIMALRQDPTANSLMAGVFTNSNTRHLTNKLGRAPTDGELYMAHFMGATGAARLITAAESNPGATAADSFPAAARANRSIFFDKNGRARNLAEVTRNLAGRFDMAKSRVAGLTGGEAVQSASFAAETARVAQAYQAVAPAIQAIPNVAQTAVEKLVPGERVFHNPYRASERRQPISNTVTELWAPKSRTVQQEQARHIARDLETRQQAQPVQVAQPVQQTAPSAPVADARTDNAPGSLGLFQDAKPDVRSLFTHGVRG
ncbi:lytic transglycosylase domain-containing protein [Pseudorhodoplanes sp.]|uniref:lytic transglycosylase domain-containing protein n=1 Tax=Pseudorhodoplanes sp. TaxID=1934341 RepID=UPI002BBA2084|nr:lytic transglycosylase domain-containing protein [Pseudorhodoplanes sp.]HWV54484.1 lytic transglycosylase domain-containing protein [Pseudorhodoplanes sp.]